MGNFVGKIAGVLLTLVNNETDPFSFSRSYLAWLSVHHFLHYMGDELTALLF